VRVLRGACKGKGLGDFSLLSEVGGTEYSRRAASRSLHFREAAEVAKRGGKGARLLGLSFPLFLAKGGGGSTLQGGGGRRESHLQPPLFGNVGMSN